jgi:hypothetical protein
VRGRGPVRDYQREKTVPASCTARRSGCRKTPTRADDLVLDRLPSRCSRNGSTLVLAEASWWGSAATVFALDEQKAPSEHECARGS